MFETLTTVVGRIAGGIRVHQLANEGRVASFRLISRSRRYDKHRQEWTNGEFLTIQVKCWDQLGTNVQASLRRDDHVLVHGQLSCREYEATDGTRRLSYEIRAEAIGPNLRHGTAEVLQLHFPDQSDIPAPRAPEPPVPARPLPDPALAPAAEPPPVAVTGPTAPEPGPVPARTPSAAVRNAAAAARVALGLPQEGDLAQVLAELDQTREAPLPVA